MPHPAEEGSRARVSHQAPVAGREAVAQRTARRTRSHASAGWNGEAAAETHWLAAQCPAHDTKSRRRRPHGLPWGLRGGCPVATRPQAALRRQLLACGSPTIPEWPGGDCTPYGRANRRCPTVREASPVARPDTRSRRVGDQRGHGETGFPVRRPSRAGQPRVAPETFCAPGGPAPPSIRTSAHGVHPHPRYASLAFPLSRVAWCATPCTPSDTCRDV